MKLWRNLVLLGGLVLVLAAANITILAKQQIVDQGRRVLLDLRPVDPRSLMQGDYMRLAYAQKVFPEDREGLKLPFKGLVVLGLDDRGSATFSRLDQGGPLADHEVRLRYKLRSRHGALRYGAESFFFQEGDSALYDEARFGVLAIDEAGNSILVGLAKEDGNLIVK